MIAKPVTGPSKLMHKVGVSKEQGFSTWRTLARSVLASEVSDWRDVSRGWMEYAPREGSSAASPSDVRQSVKEGGDISEISHSLSVGLG